MNSAFLICTSIYIIHKRELDAKLPLMKYWPDVVEQLLLIIPVNFTFLKSLLSAAPTLYKTTSTSFPWYYGFDHSCLQKFGYFLTDKFRYLYRTFMNSSSRFLSRNSVNHTGYFDNAGVLICQCFQQYITIVSSFI